MLYIAEICVMNMYHKKRLLSTKIDFWRRAVRKLKMERIRNNNVNRGDLLWNNRTEVINVVISEYWKKVKSRMGKAMAEWEPDGR